MFRIVLSLLVVFPSMVMATPSMHTLLSQGEYVEPIVVIQQVEMDHNGLVSAFDMDIENDQLIYEIELINLDTNELIAFEFDAKDGSLMSKKLSHFASDDLDQIKAAKVLIDHKMTFTDLIKLATKNQSGYLIEAELEHDLTISYLELKLLNAASKHTIAFDIENLRPLPLLQWD
ncbi:PepSY domain-containing protein [Shewanella sp. 10N.286.51.B8]|uniref:PepSY domain-containing protein n=1 Tax=Shewanella sp. 10N.286.51.B8 TaxID=3229708 RepID=UPI003550E9F8